MRIRREGRLAIVQQLVDGHAQGIHIRAVVAAEFVEDLRRHIAVCAVLNSPRDGVFGNGHAEIAQLEVIPAGGIKDVVGLYIHMDNSALFTDAQRHGYFLPDIQNKLQIRSGVRIQRPLCQIILEHDQLFHADQDVPAIGILALYDLTVLEIGDIALALQLFHHIDFIAHIAVIAVDDVPLRFRSAALVKLSVAGNRNELHRSLIAIRMAGCVALLLVNAVNRSRCALSQEGAFHASIQHPLSEKFVLIVNQQAFFQIRH